MTLPGPSSLFSQPHRLSLSTTFKMACRCPTELWTYIFFYACMDDGSTGRSLSSVSKFFNEASKFAKYQSVALRGLSQTIQFASLIEELPEIHRGVCHLFVTNEHPYATFESSEDSSPTLTSTLSSLLSNLVPGTRNKRKQLESKIDRRKQIIQEAVDQNSATYESLMHDAVYRILAIIAPTLLTLSFAFEFNFGDPKIPSLPVLTELNLRYGFHWRTPPIDKVLRTLEPLPALRRFNLVGVDCHALPGDILSKAAAFAPSLTHIYLPIVKCANLSDFGKELETAMEQSKEGNSAQTSALVFFQLDPWTQRHETLIPRGSWEAELLLCRRLVKKYNRLVLRERAEPKDECHGEQEQEWLERVSGGDGCWRLNG